MSDQPAYRADGQPVSRAAFYAAACDPRRSVVVEACAGAGKTWMLVSRIVRALLDGAMPQEILAITFTRKAAGEMRERLDTWLRAFASPTASAAHRVDELVARGVSPEAAPTWADALAGLQRRLLDSGRAVEVRTFHAWFAQLLRAAPFELLDEIGIDPDAELMQDIEDHRVELMRQFHAALLQDGARRADYEALVAARGRGQAAKWFDQVLTRRIELELADRAGTLDDGIVAVVSDGAPEPREIVASASWRVELGALAETLRSRGARAARHGELLAQAIDIADAGESYEAVRAALFTKEGTARKLGDIAGLADMQRALQDIDAQQHRHASRLEHLRMVRLARVLLAVYARYKRQRGLLDMNDLEIGALHLLRDATLSGWVQERLDARVRHLLIDEFQDTSPLQWHALHAWLSGYAGAGGGSSGQRPPSLFVVGDPKQSIYRFRRAEPRVFGAMRDFVVEALGGTVLECDHTRRNAGAVLDALNAVFDEAQRAGAFDGYRTHTTEVPSISQPGLRALPRIARPTREAGAGSADDAPVWRDSLTEPRREPEAERREAEAQAVADEIVRQLSAGCAPEAIMVLARRRAPLRELAQALLTRHVPFVAVDDATLAEAPEAQDLVAVVDALVSPRHRLSLARALRSPLFDVSDAELLALARRSAPSGDWWTALMAWDGANDALARARRLLAQWQEDARRLPPHDLLDRIVAQGELRARLASRVPAARRAIALAMVDAVLVQALALDGGRYATPYGFVRALRKRTISVPAPDLGAAVRLLTMHGAKGLEADVVFVMDADPERNRTDTATLVVDWPVEDAAPRRCAFVYNENHVAADLAGPMADELRARDREELNGLYVAMTRARHTLVFSATEPHRRGPRESWWQRVAPHATAVAHADDAPVPDRPEPPPQLVELPCWHAAPAAPAILVPAADTAAARLGQAVHRVLEWYTAAGGDLVALAAGAGAEFGAPADEVAGLAGRIVHSPQCAAFFDRTALHWAGNEVPVALDGEVLRIDRLVCLGPPADPCWWVLDYKLQGQAAADARVREQLQRYCRAVAPLAAGATVRAAVITGQGELQVVI